MLVRLSNLAQNERNKNTGFVCAFSTKTKLEAMKMENVPYVYAEDSSGGI